MNEILTVLGVLIIVFLLVGFACKIILKRPIKEVISDIFSFLWPF